MITFSTLRDHLYTGYTPDPSRVALMAWVGQYTDTGKYYTYRAEIIATDASSRTAWVNTAGWHYHHPVPFSALQSVALCQGAKVLQAFGRPPAASAPAWADTPADRPAWVQYQEVG